MGVPAGVGTAIVTVVVVVVLDRIFAPRLLSARRPSPTLTVFLIVALVDAYGFIGLLFASTLATAAESCVGRLIVTHPQNARPALTVSALRDRIASARRRLLLLPEQNAIQLAGVLARLDALAADADRPSPSEVG